MSKRPPKRKTPFQMAMKRVSYLEAQVDDYRAQCEKLAESLDILIMNSSLINSEWDYPKEVLRDYVAFKKGLAE